MMAKEVPAVNAPGKKEVVVVVMVHQQIIAHDRGKSARYSRVRAAKLAMEALDGLAPYEFRETFRCECVETDAVEVGIHADCGI